MLLTACFDTKKHEQRICLVAEKLDELVHIGLSNSPAIFKFFVPVSSCQNELSTTLNHCIIIVAVANHG